MNLKKLVVVIAACAPLTTLAQEELSTQKQKLSYTIGFNIAQRIKQNVEIDVDALTLAIRDVLSDTQPKLTEEQMGAAMDEERRRLTELQQALADSNKQAGEQFLAENMNKEGVKQTESGLQYEVIEAGTGEMPKTTDTVIVHYRGTLVDGTEFDSSYKRNNPTTFPVDGVIPGWQEGIQLMQPGAKYKFYIPSSLAYGEKGAGGAIGPNEALIFEVELLEIK